MRAAALALVVFAACGGRAKIAPISNTPGAIITSSAGGLHPGERMTYTLHAKGMEVGEIAIATGSPGQVSGHRAVVVATRGSLTGLLSMVKYVRADGESVVDLDTGAPISMAGTVDWGGYHLRTSGAFDGPNAEIHWFHGDDNFEDVSHTAPAGDIQGAVSAAAAVRAWNGSPGETRRIYVAGAFRMWTCDVTWKGNDRIDTALGTFDAVRIDAVAELDNGRRVELDVWMTDDSDHVPLRAIARSPLLSASFDITSYEPGR
jgi:hypothetical protein